LFFFQAEDGIRDFHVTGVQTCALPIFMLTGADPGADMMSAISFGVLRFTGSEGIPRTLVPLLGRLDVFALWQAALWAIGISTIYRVPRSRGFLIAACVLVLSALPEVLLALLPQPGAP